MNFLYCFYYLQYAFREWKYRTLTDNPDDFWDAINIGYYQMNRFN